jgi:hypothetical protein
MIVMPSREILCALTIGKGTHERRGTRVLRRGLASLVVENTIHRLPHKFGDGNTLPPRDDPQPPSLLGRELNLRSQHDSV